MKNRRSVLPIELRDPPQFRAIVRLRSIDASGPVKTSDSFLLRIAKALGVDLVQLADICEVSYPDMWELVRAKRPDVSRFDTDPMWNKLHAHVQQRLAALVAVRLDLDAKLQQDRVRRARERLRQETHE